MGKETSPVPQESFNFTENERLFDRISHTRFETMMRHEQTVIHEVTLSTNSFGEFLFVTASGLDAGTQRTVTFWGLGFHEPRERWLSEQWSWFTSQRTFDEQIDKDTALTEIANRRQDVLGWDSHEQPSKRGQLYALVADLTDEDGALTELDDLGDLFDDEE
jgi:hypothetical protein